MVVDGYVLGAMGSRIVIFGATGFTGRLTAERLAAAGADPVLAGRDEKSLQVLSERLGGLEYRRADVLRQNSVFDLISEGDVLVSLVGPFVKWGEPAVRAAIAAGATYFDSTGEPLFIRRVFEEFSGPAGRSGAALLTACGYDFVPGALAGALALTEAGDGAVRVDVGYFTRASRDSASAGTRRSLVGAVLNDHFAFRDGRVRGVRPAERVRSFRLGSKELSAISAGGAEHYSLPAVFSGLREVNVYIGFGALARPLQATTMATNVVTRLPFARGVMQGIGERVMDAVGGEDAAGGGRSSAIGIAYDGGGRELASVVLEGGDPYDFTAGFLAWAAQEAASGRGVSGVGGLGPVEAFGLDRLEAGVAEAGLRRVREPVRARA
jgi:short subunit dehydrogenase-like uncharacterized protein